MAARVLFPEGEATIKEYHWTAERPSFERLLNSLLDPYGPGGHDPNPDLTAAKEAMKLLGGKLLSWDESLPLEKNQI